MRVVRWGLDGEEVREEGEAESRGGEDLVADAETMRWVCGGERRQVRGFSTTRFTLRQIAPRQTKL